MRGVYRILFALLVGSFALSTLSACTSSDADSLSSGVGYVGSPNTEFSFHIVRPESNSAEAMRLAQDGKTPPGAIYVSFADNDSGLILEKRTRLNADCVKRASAGTHPTAGYPIINFSFDASCAKIFGEMTSKFVGERFAVVVNGEILTAPTINSAITGGSGFIEGNFTVSEAEKLAADINATATKKAK